MGNYGIAGEHSLNWFGLAFRSVVMAQSQSGPGQLDSDHRDG